VRVFSHFLFVCLSRACLGNSSLFKRNSKTKRRFLSLQEWYKKHAKTFCLEIVFASSDKVRRKEEEKKKKKKNRAPFPSMTHPYEMKTIICQDRLRTTIRILKKMGLHFTHAKDDSGFRGYAATMPWPSLPYKVRSRISFAPFYSYRF
jgi:hypothetical protein